MTRAFEVLNRYLGWGEPECGVWFVGLEESLGWGKGQEDQIFENYKPPNDEFERPVDPPRPSADPGAKGRGIRYKTSRIMCQVDRLAAEHDWRWYESNRLWKVGSKGCQVNLFPLGKPTRGSWPRDFKELFGFGANDREAYEKRVQESRFLHIREAWKQHRPQATICFGKEGWHHCRSIFEITSEAVPVAPGRQLLAHEQERVILTPFFAYGHVTNKDADSIGFFLRDKWKVRIG